MIGLKAKEHSLVGGNQIQNVVQTCVHVGRVRVDTILIISQFCKVIYQSCSCTRLCCSRTHNLYIILPSSNLAHSPLVNNKTSRLILHSRFYLRRGPDGVWTDAIITVENEYVLCIYTVLESGTYIWTVDICEAIQLAQVLADPVHAGQVDRL